MDFSKISHLGTLGNAEFRPALPSGSWVTGIVRVKSDDYKPAKVHVRSAIGKRMFTADFMSDDFAEIQSDPSVEDVSLSEELPLQKLPSQQR